MWTAKYLIVFSLLVRINVGTNASSLTDGGGDDFKTTENSVHGHLRTLSGKEEAKARDEEETEFLNGFFKGYDKRIRPYNERKPVVTYLNMYVNSLGAIHESTMDYRINIFLRRRWNDPRLAFSHNSSDIITLHPTMLADIWQPDVFFTNEKQANFHKVTNDNQLMRIYGNGDVYSSIRLSMTLACNMRLENFPMDIQVCDMNLECYGYGTKDLVFEWDENQPIKLPENDLTMPQFILRGFVTSSHNITYDTGDFTSLCAEFIFERQMGYYYIQMYIPSSLIVILSWVSFWINMEAAPARTALGITTVLTLTTQSSGARSALPKVSYVKAIDVWFSVCLFFVFAAILEFAIVNFISRAEKQFIKLVKKTKRHQSIKKSKEHVGTSHQNNTDFTEEGENENIKMDFLSKAQQIDHSSRYLFPMAFILFNVVYWGVYQSSRMHIETEVGEYAMSNGQQ